MARVKGMGVDYFPLDVDFNRSRKLMALGARHGTHAISLFVITHARIYREGYFIALDKLEIAAIASEAMLDEQDVNEFLKSAVEFGLFDAGKFKENILTSRSIQEQYEGCTKRRDLSKKDLPHWLLHTIVPSEGLIAYNCTVESTIARNSTQSKVKESKVKKSKEKKADPLSVNDCISHIVQTAGYSLDFDTALRWCQYKQSTNKPWTALRSVTGFANKWAGYEWCFASKVNAAIEGEWQSAHPPDIKPRHDFDDEAHGLNATRYENYLTKQKKEHHDEQPSN